MLMPQLTVVLPGLRRAVDFPIPMAQLRGRLRIQFASARDIAVRPSADLCICLCLTGSDRTISVR